MHAGAQRDEKFADGRDTRSIASRTRAARMLRLAVVMPLALALCALRLASAQMGQMSPEEEEMLEKMGVRGQPMGRKNLKPQAELLKDDMKYIRCGVCRKMVEEAYPKSQQLLEARFRYQKKHKHQVVEFDGEGAVQDFVEKLCNPLKSEGEWVSKIDLVQEGDALMLATQPQFGKCGKECRTIEATCDDVLDRADTSFTEVLYKGVKEGTPLESVQRYICNRAAGVCKKKPPLLKSRKEDEKFQPISAEDKQMQDMQSNLKESGMSGTMYRREDLAGMMDKLGDYEKMLEQEAGLDGAGGGEEEGEGESEGATRDEL